MSRTKSIRLRGCDMFHEQVIAKDGDLVNEVMIVEL